VGIATPIQDDGDSISSALDVIGDRWSLLVLRGVFRGTYRFSEIRDELGIASNLLTTRLGRLVDQGVLEKVQYQDRPIRFEYRLTAAGRALSPVLISLMQWGDQYRNDGDAPVTLLHSDCGAPIENITHCTKCGDVVDATSIRRNLSNKDSQLEST
jgi:DNA-binding HxlR family transcriptional regulator